MVVPVLCMIFFSMVSVWSSNLCLSYRGLVIVMENHSFAYEDGSSGEYFMTAYTNTQFRNVGGI